MQEESENMLAWPDAKNGPADKLRLHFPEGALGNVLYQAAIQVCEDPTCDCNEVVLLILRQEGNNDPYTPIYMSLVDRHHYARAGDLPEAERAMADLLVEHMSDADWQLLETIYGHAKFLATQAASLADPNAEFPIKEIENGSLMIRFSNIFTKASPLILDIDGTNYQLDDQYCLKSDCDCQNAGVAFVSLADDAPSMVNDPPYIQFDYNDQQWTVREKANAEDALIQAVGEQISVQSIDDALRERHVAMRDQYTTYRRQWSSYIPATRKNTVTAGRNDPCPCGSGKKYKRCCLQ